MSANTIFENPTIAKNYEATYQNQYRRADKLEKQLITKMLAEFPNAKTLLEIGCGTAHFTKWLQTKGYNCYGTDLSSGMLTEAKKLWQEGTLLRGDGSHLPLRDKSVDVAVFITSLEFISDPASALSEAARVARQGIILGLLNKNSAAGIKKALDWNRESVFSFATFHSLSGVRKLADTAFPQRHEIVFWSTTVFLRVLGNLESSRFPFGDFLGLALKLE